MAGDRQKTTPWSEVQRELQLEMWRNASDTFANYQPDLYGKYQGNINVGPSQATNRYLGSLQSAGQQRFQPLGQGLDFDFGGQQVRDAAQQLGTDKYLSPQSNPYLQQTVNAATGDVARQFSRQTLPGLHSAAQAQGAYGGSQQQKLATLQQTEAQRNAQGIAAGMYGQNFANERQLQQQGQLALPGFYNAAAGLDTQEQMIPLQFQQQERAAGQAHQQQALGYQQMQGQLTDQFRQRDADEQMQRYQMQVQRHQAAQQLPWQRYSMAMPIAFQNSGQNNEGPLVAAAGEAGGGGGFGGMLKGALGGGMGAASLASGTAMAGNPWLIGGAALAGGAGGWFG
jgi:hypothetical protein